MVYVVVVVVLDEEEVVNGRPVNARRVADGQKKKIHLSVRLMCSDRATGRRTAGQIESEESGFSLIKAILNGGWRCWRSER